MPNIGFPELMVILVVALIIFGPKSIPQIGKSIGNGIKEFKEALKGTKQTETDRNGNADADKKPE
jgi:sec-independent protein translocase protein TatA